MPLLVRFTYRQSLLLCYLLSNAHNRAQGEQERACLWALLQGIARGGVLLLLDEERAPLVHLIAQNEAHAAAIEDEVPQEQRAIAEDTMLALCAGARA